MVGSHGSGSFKVADSVASTVKRQRVMNACAWFPAFIWVWISEWCSTVLPTAARCPDPQTLSSPPPR